MRPFYELEDAHLLIPGKRIIFENNTTVEPVEGEIIESVSPGCVLVLDDENIRWLVRIGSVDQIEAEAPKETKMIRKPCPECGKEFTWLADGSRPREHKCTPVEKPSEPVNAVVDPPQEVKGLIEQVIAKYIETRDEIATRKKAFEESVEELKKFQDAREKFLAGELDKMGATSIKKNGVGVAFFKTRSSATIADGSQFMEWVRADWDSRNKFLERRVSKTAVDEFIEDGQPPPPGTNYTTVKVVQVNRG